MTHVMRQTKLPKERVRRTWCGIGENDDKRFPYVGESYVEAHVEGWAMKVCDKCAAAMETTPPAVAGDGYCQDQPERDE